MPRRGPSRHQSGTFEAPAPTYPRALYLRCSGQAKLPTVPPALLVGGENDLTLGRVLMRPHGLRIQPPRDEAQREHAVGRRERATLMQARGGPAPRPNGAASCAPALRCRRHPRPRGRPAATASVPLQTRWLVQIHAAGYARQQSLPVRNSQPGSHTRRVRSAASVQAREPTPVNFPSRREAAAPLTWACCDLVGFTASLRRR